MSALGKRLIGAAQNARKIARGEAKKNTYKIHIPDDPDVQKIRKGLLLSQEAFALRFGIPLSTLRDWEQRRRKPEVPARILLKVIEKNPKAVTKALAAA